MSSEKRPAKTQETAIIIRFRIKRGFWRLLVAGLVLIVGTALYLSAPADAYNRKTIVLDPGHGGADTGARGSGGLYEKDVALALARQVAARLDPRYEAVLTRSGDYRLDGTDRVAMANAKRADLYINIHTGAGFSSASGGITVFYGRAVSGDALAGIYAAKEPDAEVHGSDAWDLVQERHIDASRSMAAFLREALAPLAFYGEVAVRQAPLALLVGADMPAVLVEVGPVTHPAAESRLEDPAYISALAEALCAAVDRFFDNR